MKALLISGFLLLTVLASMPADARPLDEPQCMPVYQEYNLGPVSVVRRDTCHTEVFVCDDPLAEANLDCLA